MGFASEKERLQPHPAPLGVPSLQFSHPLRGPNGAIPHPHPRTSATAITSPWGLTCVNKIHGGEAWAWFQGASSRVCSQTVRLAYAIGIFQGFRGIKDHVIPSSVYVLRNTTAA